MRTIAAITMAALLAAPTLAQGPAKPGPEHALLKKQEGTWDTTMTFQGTEHKGTTTYKMDLGGLWLCGDMVSDLGGQKYMGKSLDTYDAEKKKFVGVWVDSMGTQPMVFEGALDPAAKALTMTADGVGMDGKPAKWKSVATMPDADTIHFKMFVGDAKEPMFTVVYKRKK